MRDMFEQRWVKGIHDDYPDRPDWIEENDDNCEVCGKFLIRDGGGYLVCPDDSDEHDEKRLTMIYGPMEVDGLPDHLGYGGD